MKAAQISEYGGASVVEVNEVGRPMAGEGQVVVEVRAASLNPFDSKIREGYMKDVIPLRFPATLGGDIAGTVVEVGADVTGFAAGDKVYGQAYVMGGGSGALAEFAATRPKQIAKAPANLDLTEAASLPLVGVSALQALTEHISLQSGQKILIHGGSGGIGTVAIQIAKHLGAYVATTVPTEVVDAAKELGANEVIDYRTQDFTVIIRDYDAIFDTVGGEVFEKSLAVLRPGGIAVTMAGRVDEATAKAHGVTAIAQGTGVTTERLDKLTKMIEGGIVTPHVAKVFPLSQIQEAFEYRESQSFTGKVVIEIG
ncbi:MAG TPA: NADP-dependent oxidoreductase [Candidatus Saccharimonadales bacterium]